MTVVSEVAGDAKYVSILDHGFVGLVDIMGSDGDIDRAARCSYGQGTRSVSDMRGLIRYLVRHLHTSPLEMVELKFHLKMPIFIMRQHVRHRTASLNEYSGRYSEMTDEFYLPDIDRFQGQHKDNKQASGDVLNSEDSLKMQQGIEFHSEVSYTLYQELLSMGLAREVARTVLPVSNFTECYWKINLKNFLHYIKLRMHSHAQYEIRVMAEAMWSLVKPLIPITAEAFEDYWLNSESMSQMEMKLIKQVLSDFGVTRINCEPKLHGITKKELNELNEKLGFEFRL